MRLYFLIAMAITCCNTNAQMKKRTTGTANRETDFGKSILHAFLQHDVDAFTALYPTNAEYKAILQAGLAAKAEGLTQQKIDDMLAKRNTEAAAAYAALFKQYQAMADSVGVKWSDALFEKFDFNAVYPVPVKLKYLEATIWFRCGKRHYAIDGIQAVEIPAGYRLQGITNILQVDDGD